MLSHLDRILFPDRCEVIEVVPSQRYVYPIFKNGRSSLYMTAEENKWRIKINKQIAQLDNIDVIIREPTQRLISGINTFIHQTVRDNVDLDYATVKWFALNYLYLNRHYCPQFFWLINLGRYLNPTTQLNFLSMSAINTITTRNAKPDRLEPAGNDLVNEIKQIKNNEMCQRIDMVIFECIGKSMTFNQLTSHIKTLDPVAYEYVIGHAQQILNPTYALS